MSYLAVTAHGNVSPEAHVRPGLTVDHHRDGQVLLNGSSADRSLTGVCARVVFPHILNAE